MKTQRPWIAWGSLLILAVTLIQIVRTDLSHAERVAKLSLEGSPAPALDASSPTGYVLGQRHFLGLHDRGETFRWIAYTQGLLAHGLEESQATLADNAPEGRPQLAPTIYAAWIASVSWTIHLAGDIPLPIAVEKAALYEPIVTHALAFLALSLFLWRRYGPIHATIAALVFAIFPLFYSQFIPGTLNTDTWALLLAAYALAKTIPTKRHPSGQAFSIGSAIATSLALCLDPSIGFTVVVMVAVLGVVRIAKKEEPAAYLKWAIIGSAIATGTWLIDQNPMATSAGELRYLHPLYALAWIGLGLALNAAHCLRQSPNKRGWHIAKLAIALPLVSALPYSQIANSYEGWLFSSASIQRLSTIDETLVFKNALAWIAQTNVVIVLFLALPALAAIGLLLWTLYKSYKQPQPIESKWITIAIVALLTLAVSYFKIRWGLVLSLIAIPIILEFLSSSKAPIKNVYPLTAVFLFFFVTLGLGKSPPDFLDRSISIEAPSKADVEALIYRHLSHWVATHNPDRATSLFAPPELSDSLRFHAGSGTLMSTAWETYPGQIAGSRLLSALEDSEADAVLSSTGITHIIIPSWDPTLPLFVKKPQEEGKDTQFDRLMRWVFPPYLRAIPYHMPPTPGYEEQKMLVLEVTEPQDDALLLSRLTEYFIEMNRPEPAKLAAASLKDAYPNDPNAAIARAFSHAESGEKSAFTALTSKMGVEAKADRIRLDWDRRILRAILLASSNQHSLAKPEIKACLDSMSEEKLHALTPLQNLQLQRIVKLYKMEFPSAELLELSKSLSSEYNKE